MKVVINIDKKSKKQIDCGLEVTQKSNEGFTQEDLLYWVCRHMLTDAVEQHDGVMCECIINTYLRALADTIEQAKKPQKRHEGGKKMTQEQKRFVDGVIESIFKNNIEPKDGDASQN